jgi:Fuc2NAc and GlcNAc transferase
VTSYEINLWKGMKFITLFNILLLFSFFVVSIVSLFVYKKIAIKFQILDYPTARSSHRSPRPRGSGIVFVFLWFIFLLFFLRIKYLHIYGWAIIPSAVLTVIIAFLDDLWCVSAKWRLLVYFIAAILSVIWLKGFPMIDLGVRLLPVGIVGSILAVIAIVWSINLYNFMDGIDGLAALEAVFVFGMGGYFLWMMGGYSLAMLSFGLVSIMLGFLMWNFPPAKMFMGDAGSTFLGFLIPVFSFFGEKFYHLPALLWAMLYGFFIFDASITLIRRMIYDVKWYEPHRLHAFQRLQLKHASHHKALTVIFFVNCVVSTLAFLAFCFQRYLLIYLGIEIVFLLLFYIWVEKNYPMYCE